MVCNMKKAVVDLSKVEYTEDGEMILPEPKLIEMKAGEKAQFIAEQEANRAPENEKSEVDIIKEQLADLLEQFAEFKK